MDKLTGKITLTLSLEQVEELNAMVDKITAKPAKLFKYRDETIKPTNHCPACDQVVNQFEWCPYCGQHIDTENYEI